MQLSEQTQEILNTQAKSERPIMKSKSSSHSHFSKIMEESNRDEPDQNQTQYTQDLESEIPQIIENNIYLKHLKEKQRRKPNQGKAMVKIKKSRIDK